MMPGEPISNPEIPGYQIEDVAGVGGMSVVYRATEIGSGRQVAIKMFPERVEDVARLARLEREAQIIGALEHPHILPVYRFALHEGRPFLVTRFLEGGSVKERLKTGPIPIDLAVRWIIGVAEGVDIAHERGILHRDIKPGNMLLDSQDHVYLADFGVAGTMYLDDQGRGGSAAYMSPEQCLEEEPFTPAADVYSLAVSLFEMVTGRLPYTADSILALQVKHIEASIPSARDLEPRLSRALDDAIAWGMEKSAADRPPRGAAFAAALRLALSVPDKKVRWQNGEISQEAQSFPIPVYSHVGSDPPAASSPVDRVSPQAGRLGLAGWLLVVLLAAAAGWLLLSGPFSRPGTVSGPTAAPPVLQLPTSVVTPVGRLYFDDFGAASRLADASDEARLVDETLELSTGDPRFRIFWAADMAPTGMIRVETDWLPLELPDQFEVGLLCRFENPENYWGGIWVFDGRPRLEIWRVAGGQIAVEGAVELSDVARRTFLAGGRPGLACGQAQVGVSFDDLALLEVDFPEDGLQGTAAVMIRPLTPAVQTVRFDNFAVWER